MARTQEAEAELRDHGLDGLVLYANGSTLGNQARTHGYMRYFCDFDSHNFPAVFILRPGEPAVLITGNANARNNRDVGWEKSLWVRGIRHVTAQALGDEIVKVLGAGNGAPRRVAYLGYNETLAPVWKAIERGLPGVEWDHEFGARVLDKHRVQKSPQALAIHRHAAEICDLMFARLAREVRSGKPGYQLQAAMEHTAKEEGCEYCLIWLTVLPHADFSRFNKEECLRAPQEGDQVLAGIYIIYEGHWGHAIRTGNVGEPTPEHRLLYDRVNQMIDAGLGKIRPGDNLHDVNTAMTKVWQKYYQPHEIRRSRPGHGLGYSYEDPIVSQAFPYAWNVKDGPQPEPIVIKPGMLMELHPQIWVPGAGGAMIGEMVAATDTGYEVLTRYPRALQVW
ncbi:MAG: M24 family metallopeptidase [Burkholderiales bacterium]